jgi:hypothetical protein
MKNKDYQSIIDTADEIMILSQESMDEPEKKEENIKLLKKHILSLKKLLWKRKI